MPLWDLQNDIICPNQDCENVLDYLEFEDDGSCWAYCEICDEDVEVDIDTLEENTDDEYE